MAQTLAVELVEDLSFYPRNVVDDIWVSHLAQKLRGGAILPPLAVDKTSKRIVDGVHRRRANMRVFGKDCKVPVEWLTFKNDGELYLEAIRRNATHGKPLSTVDWVRCVERGQHLNLSVDVVANALNIDVDKLQGKVDTRLRTDDEGVAFVLKVGTVTNGKHVSRAQRNAISMQGCRKASLYAYMLTQLLENDVLDLTEQVVVDLVHLRDLLTSKFPVEDK